MGKQKAPAAPNYAPIIAAQTQAATSAQNLATQQQQWATGQYAADRANTDKVVATTLEQQGALNTNAAADRARYDTTYQPLEYEFIQNAQKYSDPTQINSRAAASAGDVSQQFDVARANAQRQLEAYGVDPTQTRAAALDLGTRTQEAAARASAMNVSRRQDAVTGQQMLGQAIQQGNTTANRGLQETQLGLQAGSSAVSNDLATTASGASTMGTGTQFTSLANGSLAGAANTTNQQYSNRLDEYKANQASSSGLGSILGTVAGMGLKSYDSGGRIGTAIAGLFDEGGTVPTDDEMHAGIRVTRDMSPSGGAMTDDVPARLNAGEFVLPADTVRWVGEKHLQQLIRKSGEERSQAGAKPRMQALPIQRPQVDTTGALDVMR
ncbi:virion-associated phage protein [Methylobacterium sp. GXF4]|uniref:hypothetical protein n=1 Tax=Methylobacterium sp. GXF4 TaxID=1096546 RepID=UPI0002698F4E|nr:hypothetical protein [Methylobacterium sp. GXF4]EIZ87145.1 virion-associated phage protein [Methylobacterium sp. GXF4]